MPRYFAHISQHGSIRYDAVPGSIGILEAPDKPMPIGEASCRTHDENGLAVWTLRIGKEEIPIASGEAWGQTEFQVNLKLGLTPWRYRQSSLQCHSNDGLN